MLELFTVLDHKLPGCVCSREKNREKPGPKARERAARDVRTKAHGGRGFRVYVFAVNLEHGLLRRLVDCGVFALHEITLNQGRHSQCVSDPFRPLLCGLVLASSLRLAGPRAHRCSISCSCSTRSHLDAFCGAYLVVGAADGHGYAQWLRPKPGLTERASAPASSHSPGSRRQRFAQSSSAAAAAEPRCRPGAVCTQQFGLRASWTIPRTRLQTRGAAQLPPSQRERRGAAPPSTAADGRRHPRGLAVTDKRGACCKIFLELTGRRERGMEREEVTVAASRPRVYRQVFVSCNPSKLTFESPLNFVLRKQG